MYTYVCMYIYIYMFAHHAATMMCISAHNIAPEGALSKVAARSCISAGRGACQGAGGESGKPPTGES